MLVVLNTELNCADTADTGHTTTIRYNTTMALLL